MGGDGGARALDVGADIDVAHVNQDPGIWLASLALDARRTDCVFDAGQTSQRNLGAGGRWHEHRAQGRQVVAQLPAVAKVHRVARQAFDRGRQVGAANGGLNDVLDVANGQAVAGNRFAVDVEVQVAAPHHPLGIDAGGSGQRPYDRFDFLAEPLKLRQVRAPDLDADGCADAGGEHVDAGLDWHRPSVGEPRHLDGGVHLLGQPLRRHPRPPFALGLELDRGFDHRQGCGIGRGVRAAELAEDVLDFGKGAQDPIRLLHDLGGLGDGDAGQRGRHVEQVAFPEPGHELGTEAHPRQCGQGQPQDRGTENEDLEAHCACQQRPVQPSEQPADRMLVERANPAPHGVADQHRNQGHCQQRRRGHRVGLGEGQRLEEPALLGFKGEDGQERDRDHEQRKEERRAHLPGRLRDHLPVRPPPLVAGEVVVRALHHHDAGVNQGSDGDRDAAEGHDIEVELLEGQRHEGGEDGEGQGDDGHQSAPDVKQEEQADQPYDSELLT